ncbi:MAG TPA: hypothetical protein VMS16_01740 [Mycobacterium sp.]|nr:hypothetical protein [Mycobacterium sp.]
MAVSASVLKLLAPAMVGKSPEELLWCRGDGQPLRPPTTTQLVRRGGEALPGNR